MVVRNRRKFYRKAKKLKSGLEDHPEVPILHVPAAVFGPVVKAGTDAEEEFQLRRAFTSVANGFLGGVRLESVAWSTKARDGLKAFLGSGGWNMAYVSVGFTTPSLAIPQSVEDLLDLVPKLAGHFKKFPKREQPEADLTFDFGDKLGKKLEAADKALGGAERDQRTKRDARETAETAIGQKMTKLLKELDTALDPKDPRWLDFIGDIPGDPQRPEVVEELVVTGGLPGELKMEFIGGPRGERFKIEIFVVGQDKEFRRVATVKDEETTLTKLPPGAEVKVRVTGANKVGDGPPCAPVTVKVPALPQASQAA